MCGAGVRHSASPWRRSDSTSSFVQVDGKVYQQNQGSPQKYIKNAEEIITRQKRPSLPAQEVYLLFSMEGVLSKGVTQRGVVLIGREVHLGILRAEHFDGLVRLIEETSC